MSGYFQRLAIRTGLSSAPATSTAPTSSAPVNPAPASEAPHFEVERETAAPPVAAFNPPAHLSREASAVSQAPISSGSLRTITNLSHEAPGVPSAPEANIRSSSIVSKTEEPVGHVLPQLQTKPSAFAPVREEAPLPSLKPIKNQELPRHVTLPPAGDTISEQPGRMEHTLRESEPTAPAPTKSVSEVESFASAVQPSSARPLNEAPPQSAGRRNELPVFEGEAEKRVVPSAVLDAVPELRRNTPPPRAGEGAEPFAPPRALPKRRDERVPSVRIGSVHVEVYGQTEPTPAPIQPQRVSEPAGPTAPALRRYYLRGS